MPIAGRANRMRRCRGFTLIEIMVTVAIMAILAAVAVPVYTSHVRDSARAEAQAALEGTAARMERFFFDNSNSTGDLTELGYAASPASSGDGRYLVTAAAGLSGNINTSFQLSATAVDASFDPECTALTLNSLGARGHTGTAPTSDVCW